VLQHIDEAIVAAHGKVARRGIGKASICASLATGQTSIRSIGGRWASASLPSSPSVATPPAAPSCAPRT
jgi:hypothetical protein